MHGRFTTELSHSGTQLLRLTSLEDMAAVEELWRSLDARSTQRLVWFQSFDWCYQWMRHHGARALTPLVFMLVTDGEAVAILPLMRKRNPLRVTSLRSLGAPHTQYANLLTLEGHLTPTERDMLQDALAREPGADQLLFDLVPDASPLLDLLPRDTRQTTLDNEACHLDLRRFESSAAYEAELGKKTARNLRRATSQLEQKGSLSFDVVRPENPGYQHIVIRSLAMKARWLAATGRISSGLEHRGHDRFLAAIRSEKSGDGAIAFVLRLDGKPIAIELGYLQRGHYYAYIGAFDWDWRNISPGKLQMHKSIIWLIDAGVTTLDLLGNPSDYKQHYATHGVALSGYAVNRSWRGKAYTAVWTRNLRPSLRAAFHVLPEHWRTSLHVMRKIEYTFVA